MHQVDLRWRVYNTHTMKEARSLMKLCEYRGYGYLMLYDYTYLLTYLLICAAYFLGDAPSKYSEELQRSHKTMLKRR